MTQQLRRTIGDMPLTTAALTSNECDAFYQTYIRQVPEQLTLTQALNESRDKLLDYLNAVGEARSQYSYAPGKWTVAQSLQHIIDSERIFSTRALRIGRGDASPQPGYEQDDYALSTGSPALLQPLINEFEVIRQGTQMLFGSFAEADLTRRGIASRSGITVRALGFICAGHTYHHARLYEEAYGRG